MHCFAAFSSAVCCAAVLAADFAETQAPSALPLCLPWCLFLFFAPVLTGAEMHGDIRTARFGNGLVVHERVIDVDDARRRVAHSALDSPVLTYHHASMQIIEEAPDRCRFVWTTDFLPAEAANDLRGLIEAGTAALKTNLERVGQHARAGRS